MWKRTAILLLVLALSAAVFAGCQSTKPTLTETTEPLTEPATQPTVTEEGADSRLSDFDSRLNAQGIATFEEFLANYEEARGLYFDGIRPETSMPSYAPGQGQSAPGDFYCALLDPDTYGVTKFFVLPAGERSLSAEEYLELVACSGAMPAQDLVLPENAWLSTQPDRTDPLASRLMYRSEKFWLSYLLGMYYQGQELPAEERTLCVLSLPLPVENAVFTLYPTGHLSPRGLLDAGLRSLDAASPSRKSKYIPPEDTDYEALRSAAIAAVLEHTDVAADPSAVYFGFVDTTSPSADTRSYSWTVGLFYPDGSSYTVQLDGPDRDLISLQKLPEGALDLSGDWSKLDTELLNTEEIYHKT